MTTPSGAEQARKTRKRRLHERQAAVFGLLATSLVLVLVASVFVFTGAIKFPFDRSFTTESDDSPYSDVKAPCPAPETFPSAVTGITVRVLNASSRPRLAGAIAAELDNRGFVNVEPETFSDEEASRTQVRFGIGGLAQAYTVAEHFDNPQLLLDARAPEDLSVDVIIGTSFEDMVPAEAAMLDVSIPLQSPKGCEAVEQVTPIPVIPVPTPSASTDEQPAAG